MVEFRSSNSWGAAFCVDVLHHGMLAGHIRRQLATGMFRYYSQDAHDDLQPIFQDRDLEALKRRIRETTHAGTVGQERAGRETATCVRLALAHPGPFLWGH